MFDSGSCFFFKNDYSLWVNRNILKFFNALAKSSGKVVICLLSACQFICQVGKKNEKNSNRLVD